MRFPRERTPSFGAPNFRYSRPAREQPEMSAETDEEKKAVTAETEANGEVTSGTNENATEAADPVAEAKAEAARMKEQWMRTAADFDNFRKRSRRELED